MASKKISEECIQCPQMQNEIKNIGEETTWRFKISLRFIYAMFAIFSIVAGGLFVQIEKLNNNITTWSETTAKNFSELRTNQVWVIKRQDDIISKQGKFNEDKDKLSNSIDNLNRDIKTIKASIEPTNTGKNILLDR